MAIQRELGDRSGMAASLEGFASLASCQGPERAGRLWGAAERLREEIGAPRPPDEREKHDRETSAASQALGEEASAAAWAEGRAMSLDEAVAYAMESGADGAPDARALSA